jgi:hypothetical protein
MLGKYKVNPKLDEWGTGVIEVIDEDVDGANVLVGWNEERGFEVWFPKSFIQRSIDLGDLVKIEEE